MRSFFLKIIEDILKEFVTLTVYHDFSFGLVRVAHTRIESGVSDFTVFNDELSFPAFFFDLHPNAKIIYKNKFLKQL